MFVNSILSSNPRVYSKMQMFNSKPENNTKIAIAAFAGLAILGITSVVIGQKFKENYDKALKNAGVELRNGIAFLKNGEEKFTGIIKRSLMPFGLKTEETKFVNGIISEQITYNAFNKELSGKFYKDGILRLNVGSGKYYSMSEFDKTGKLVSLSTCKLTKNDRFNSARKVINQLDR